jgi:uncharacterized membrane protein YhaH (DUF805 family)
MNESFLHFLQTLGIILLVCLVLATVLLALVVRRLRRINLPPDADFWTTLRAVPFPLVLSLDLLDLALDVLATPIVWAILSRFRLQALRNVAMVEALIPFTQALPTFTVAWIVARLFGLGQHQLSNRRVIDVEEVGPDRSVPRAGRR